MPRSSDFSLFHTHCAWAARGLRMGAHGFSGQSSATTAMCVSWPRESIYLVCDAKIQLFFGVLSEKPLRDLGFFKEFSVSCLWGALLVVLISDTAEKKSVVLSEDKKSALSIDPIQNEDLMIALREGKCQCAHPISSFVSYNYFSSSSCFFIASLDSISLPNTVREALSHPGWRSAMVDMGLGAFTCWQKSY